MTPDVRPLVAGNWKMNGVKSSLGELAAMRSGVERGEAGVAEVVICPPATLIAHAASALTGSAVGLGGQDQAHAHAHQRMVVDQEHANGHRLSPKLRWRHLGRRFHPPASAGPCFECRKNPRPRVEAAIRGALPSAACENRRFGSVAERFKAPDLKSGDGSNHP